MALTATVEILGLRELNAALEALPREVAGPIMEDALKAPGELIRAAAAGNIKSKTGRTAADIRAEIHVDPPRNSGVVGVGGTIRGRTGRAYVLRWLEFGARGKKSGGQGWDIKGGAEDRRLARKAARALRRAGDAAAARALQLGLRTGSVTMRRALKLPGGIFRAAAHHRGFPPQSPLTRALVENADAALKVFGQELWDGIAAVAKTAPKAR